MFKRFLSILALNSLVAVCLSKCLDDAKHELSIALAMASVLGALGMSISSATTIPRASGWNLLYSFGVYLVTTLAVFGLGLVLPVFSKENSQVIYGYPAASVGVMSCLSLPGTLLLWGTRFVALSFGKSASIRA